MGMLFIIFQIMIGCITAHFAEKRGRDPFVWFIFGILLGVFGIILVFILSPKTKGKETLPLQLCAQNDLQNEYIQKKWYYLDQLHCQQGPLAFDALIPVWKDHIICSHSYVWSEGMLDWKKIEELPRFEKTLEDKSQLFSIINEEVEG